MIRKAAVLGVIAVALTLSVTAYPKGTMDTLGVSSRGTAMGGAMVSIANGWEAVYYNSSALALSRDSSSIQFSSVTNNLEINGEQDIEDGFVAKFGINRRFLRDRIGAGLVVGMNTSSLGNIVDLDLGAITGGGPPNWSWDQYNDPFPIILNAGMGFRITDWLAVGINAAQKDSLISTSNYQLVVDPLLEAVLGIGTGVVYSNLEGMSFSVGGDEGEDYTTGFNVTLRPIKYFSFGYSYAPESWSTYHIRLQLAGGQGGIMGEDQFYFIEMKAPGQVETTVYGAAAHVPVPWTDGLMTLAYSHEAQNWQGFYPSSKMYDWSASTIFTPGFFQELAIKDPGLENIEFDRYGFEYVGDVPSAVRVWKLKNLNNMKMSVRGGYYHWVSPQPDAIYEWQVAMVDSDADVYSFGLGVGWDKTKGKRAVRNPLNPPRIEIDFHFQQTTLDDRDYNLRPDQWGSLPIEDFYVETSGSITQFGVQVTWWK